MTLDDAISLLLDVHTREDEPPINFTIIMGETPRSGWHRDHYAEAWRALWEHREQSRRPLAEPAPKMRR